MTWMMWGLFAIIVGVGYQTTLKTFASQIPFYVFGMTFGVAFFTLGLTNYLFFRKDMTFSIMENPKLLLGIGLAALFGASIDLSYYFLYNSGAPLALTRTILTVAVSLILLLIGKMFFDESISTLQLAGIILSVAGLTMIVWK